MNKFLKNYVALKMYKYLNVLKETKMRSQKNAFITIHKKRIM